MIKEKNQTYSVICDFKNIISLDRLIFFVFLNMLILVSKLRFEPLNTVNFRFSIFQKMDLKLKQFDTLEKTFFLKFDIFEWIFTTPILFCFDDRNIFYSQIKKNMASTINK